MITTIFLTCLIINLFPKVLVIIKLIQYTGCLGKRNKLRIFKDKMTGFWNEMTNDVLSFFKSKEKGPSTFQVHFKVQFGILDQNVLSTTTNSWTYYLLETLVNTTKWRLVGENAIENIWDREREHFRILRIL